ncbi:molybdopterin biosynthesis protein [Piscinibacter koreensis]|uniref:Molybdopterin molybdenumtransferase n=1 Tax=Piscinibacter koreensis TaxID=2742824 RepID=A0A7Y6NS52_9BURK|nr:molybdopterin biosynthesis protein [Schlegelella koreensis]NUZ08335.1 molybdopterin biosynthesis protein [Schlegelella koreensis]
MSDLDPPRTADGRQTQFLTVITRDEATERFRRHLRLEPLGHETVTLAGALNRVLAADVIADVDVPGFDRSNVDGFAVQAADTFGAGEEDVRRLVLNREVLSPGVVSRAVVSAGRASVIATGAMLPRGADAVVMVEHTDVASDADGTRRVAVARPVTAGENVSYAGTDIARGETVLRAGQPLTSREIGVLAAIGIAEVRVWRRPRVAIISTGDEIVAPGAPLPLGSIYDSNGAIVAAAVAELGGEPVPLGVVRDDEAALVAALDAALAHDMVLLSGGTSKGAGDLSYRVASRLGSPGIVAHGVALKPGKPICLAVSHGKPVVILPGFPTSAIFTFHEFVAPVIRAFGGLPPERRHSVESTLPMRVNSERGRTEYLLVGLVQRDDGLAAYPMGKGSGSVTTFSHADGFITIDQHTEIVESGSAVAVQLLGKELEAADLVVIGSHCVGLDALVGRLVRQGLRAKTLNVGSMGGARAAARGECDVASVHLMDPQGSGYNRHLLDDTVTLIPGYRRLQGIVFRPGDTRFEGRGVDDAVAAALADADCTMVNRNAGSGTRVLVDRLLGARRPPGFGVQTRSHNAVAAAVQQHRADWGVAIDTVARQYGLGFIPMQEEHYDFIVPRARLERPGVQAFLALLADPAAQSELRALGFRL